MDFSSMWAFFRELLIALDRSEKRLILEAICFAFLLWRLKRSRLALRAVVVGMEQTLKKQISALGAAAEAAPAETPQAQVDRWEKIRGLWQELRDRMEHAIDTRIDDGRKLRKYSRLTRHTYAPIIQLLRRDIPLSGDAARALDSMNEKFLSLRRSRSPSAAEVQEFETQYSIASQELPTLPTTEED